MNFCLVNSTKAGKEDYGSVYARYRSGSINKKYAIGFVLKTSNWELYSSKKYNSDALIPELKISFGKFANILEQIKNYFDNSFDPNKVATEIKAIRMAMLKENNDDSLKREANVKPYLLVDFMEQTLHEYSTGKRQNPKSKRDTSKVMVKYHKPSITSIKNFEKDCEYHFSLEEVNMDFRNEFINWNLEKGVKKNTVNGYLGTICAFMRIAIDDKLTKNDECFKKGFIPPREETFEVYLTPGQLQQLYELDLSDHQQILDTVGNFEMCKTERFFFESRFRPTYRNFIEEARDIFLIGCFTGQRHSDYSRINSNMIKKMKGISFVELTQVKTGKTISIPMDRRVKAILNKYNGELPEMRIRYFNFAIRLVAELLGWTWEPSLNGLRRGGYEKGNRFCDMITSHTARRTFATNAYAAGVPLQSILVITGHSREERLRTYLRLDRQEKGIIAANAFEKLVEIKKA